MKSMKTITLIAMLCFAIFLSACGATAANQQSNAGTVKEIVIAEPSHVTSFLPLYIGVHKGLFEEQGLKVSVQLFQTGAGHTNAVLRGDAWGFIGGPEHNAFSTLKDKNIKSIVNIGNRASYWLVGSDSFNYTGNLHEDLKGKTIVTGPFGGTPATNTYYFVINDAKLDPKNDVTILEVDYPAIATTVIEGRADVAYVSEPALSNGLREGRLNEPFYSPPLEWGPYAYSAINVPESTLEEDPETALKFVKAMVAANELLYTDPEVAVEVGQIEFPGIEADVLRMAINRYIEQEVYSKDGALEKEAVEMALEQVKVVGLLEENVSIDDIVDTSFLEQAAREKNQ